MKLGNDAEEVSDDDDDEHNDEESDVEEEDDDDVEGGEDFEWGDVGDEDETVDGATAGESQAGSELEQVQEALVENERVRTQVFF